MDCKEKWQMERERDRLGRFEISLWMQKCMCVRERLWMHARVCSLYAYACFLYILFLWLHIKQPQKQ